MQTHGLTNYNRTAILMGCRGPVQALMTGRIEYTTLEGKDISLARLIAAERRFLGRLYSRYKEGVSYLTFEGLYSHADSPIHSHAKRLGRRVEETPLYAVCEDLARRLGIRQGFLVKSEVVRDSTGAAGERRELTTGQAAKLAGCTLEGVRKAIRTGRLRARRVGRLSLIWEEDARAFAEARRPSRLGLTPRKGRV